MLATKNPARWLFAISVAAAMWIFTGCTASGPRALLDGERALREGQFSIAIEKLKRATELIPDEPRAWNLLGLAYHYAGQPQPAAHAYGQALKRDRSNIVAVAHFNLGCLLLEQGNPAVAADELRSFTMTTNSALAWVKLGEAQMRLRQFDAAERSFGNAVRSQQKEVQPMAWNNLGVIAAQRNRTREAFQHLNTALIANPKYPPALLNSAVLAQQNTSSRSYALQRYQDYLALAPRSSQLETVRAMAQQLERELTPRPLATTNVAAPTNTVARAPATIVAKTNVPVAAATSNPAPVIVATAPPRIAAVMPTNPPVRTAPPVVRTNMTAAPKPPATTSAPPNVPVTMVAVSPPAPIVIATSLPSITRLAPSPRPNTNTVPPLVTAPPIAASSAPAPARDGFFQRLNPFRNRPGVGAVPDTGRVVAASSLSPASPAGTTTARKIFSRYHYVNPPAPKAGSRAEAVRAFEKGAKAQRAGNTNEALLAYGLAMGADPSFINAQYNHALLTQQGGDAKAALPLWEIVLALEPDSINARYNFALALKQADFPQDAAVELERILDAKPTEARAHLTLANLSAQQLGDIARARRHYMKVLELDPRTSQAPAIRFWLAANP
jgi:tetratricopeptide (TPR) repeat protein